MGLRVIYVLIYIYIYIEREREKEREMLIGRYIHKHMFVYVAIVG